MTWLFRVLAPSATVANAWQHSGASVLVGAIGTLCLWGLGYAAEARRDAEFG